jgi:hypothetical protein
MKRFLTVLVMPLGVYMLQACSAGCDLGKDTKKSEFESEALYPQARGGDATLPPDTWTRNPSLEAFIGKALKIEGLSALAAKYALQCVPTEGRAGCSDCFTCRKTFRDWRVGFRTPPIPIYIEIAKCIDYGQVRVEATIGPGVAVEAMTYWKTTPEAHEDLAEDAARRRERELRRRLPP